MALPIIYLNQISEIMARSKEWIVAASVEIALYVQYIYHSRNAKQ